MTLSKRCLGRRRFPQSCLERRHGPAFAQHRLQCLRLFMGTPGVALWLAQISAAYAPTSPPSRLPARLPRVDPHLHRLDWSQAT